MFRIKICGVRLKSDIDAVGAVGGDAVGINFFSASIRFVDPNAAATRDLAEHARAVGLIRVGVFVNESSDTINAIASSVGLDAVQLHGDETIESMVGLTSSKKIRAIKLPTIGLSADDIGSATGPWIDAGYHVLLDADAGAQHGGSGKTLPWSVIGQWAAANRHVRWTLAGGLTPSNVAEAIRVSGAVSVDTASGVESTKGTKSAELIGMFVASCKK